MKSQSITLALCISALAGGLAAQKYNGPKPEKADVLYLLHATNLVETEVLDAREEKRKDDVAYIVPGAASKARTPLAEPIFLLESKKVLPERLQLYKLDVRNGNREVLMSKRKKDGARPLHLSLKRLGEGIYRIEANEFLANGEYAVTPEGSNTVFLFQVY